MGDEAKEVKLYGSRASPYCALVHHALRLKGVAYEYVEEDLANKSESLLRLNPVHKKVPVLVVDGKPIAESLVILEFIDEAWKADPPLLPSDPYLRAKVRFWAGFFYQKMVPASSSIIRTDGEVQQKATEEFIEHMTTLEAGIAKDLPSKGPWIGGERPGLLDLVIGSCAIAFRVLGNISGRVLLEKERTPLLSSAVAAYEGLEVFKDTTLPYDKMLEYFRAVREKALASLGA